VSERQTEAPGADAKGKAADYTLQFMRRYVTFVKQNLGEKSLAGRVLLLLAVALPLLVFVAVPAYFITGRGLLDAVLVLACILLAVLILILVYAVLDPSVDTKTTLKAAGRLLFLGILVLVVLFAVDLPPFERWPRLMDASLKYSEVFLGLMDPSDFVDRVKLGKRERPVEDAEVFRDVDKATAKLQPFGDYNKTGALEVDGHPRHLLMALTEIGEIHIKRSISIADDVDPRTYYLLARKISFDERPTLHLGKNHLVIAAFDIDVGDGATIRAFSTGTAEGIAEQVDFSGREAGNVHLVILRSIQGKDLVIDLRGEQGATGPIGPKAGSGTQEVQKKEDLQEAPKRAGHSVFEDLRAYMSQANTSPNAQRARAKLMEPQFRDKVAKCQKENITCFIWACDKPPDIGKEGQPGNPGQPGGAGGAGGKGGRLYIYAKGGKLLNDVEQTIKFTEGAQSNGGKGGPPGYPGRGSSGGPGGLPDSDGLCGVAWSGKPGSDGPDGTTGTPGPPGTPQHKVPDQVHINFGRSTLE